MASSRLTDENLADRERKARVRRESSVVVIPKCEDRDRRERLEADDKAWLLYYFGKDCGLSDPFWYEFTAQQSEMIAAIGHAIEHGDDQALAASRGEGKTTIAERLTLKYALQGKVDYSVIFGASGAMADNILDSIKTAIAENVLLAADYPEVCVPVAALEGAPQRANTQRVTGHRHDNGAVYEEEASKFTWCGQELIFPRVPGSPSAGAIIATRGLDAAVRGLKKRGKRPKLAIIDDPDTEDTARSEEQAKKLEKRIDAAIGGLGGQQRGIGRVMLTTLQSRIAASYKYTNRKEKPTFKGRRFRFLVKKPDRMDLWDEYIQLRIEDLQRVDEEGRDLDEFCRRSHGFYIEHLEDMNAGAIISNPNRFDGRLLFDGTQLEVSALQRYFNEVCKLGPEVVATEYDNDPPEEAGIVESGITPTRIQRQVSGLERGVVPSGCILVTQGVDVRKSALHWVLRAWMQDGTGYTIDYGVHEVRGTVYGSEEGLDVAIRRAILERMEAAKAGPQIALTLIDAGYRTDAVYGACHELGVGVMPIMGFGKSSGCIQANFNDVQRKTADKKPGDGWFLSRKGKLWLVCAEADRWKAWEHDRWMTGPDKPGRMEIFGFESENPARLSDDQKSHHSYARHICNEREVEEMVRGSLKRYWKARSDNNHWLDASYYSCVAANMKGVRIDITQTAKPIKVIPGMNKPAGPIPVSRPTAAELMARARG